MEELHCIVERIIYRNIENDYSVLMCRVVGEDSVTIKGFVPEVHRGSVLELRGSWQEDEKYGLQFAIEGNS